MDAPAPPPGSFATAYERAARRLEHIRFADQLWNRSLSVWAGGPEVGARIANRLGWLSALDFLTPHVARLGAFAESVRAAGFTDVVLLGMGGSSLAPEVLRQVIGTKPGHPRFRVLDSVDPDAVRAAMEASGTSLFVLASKSGTTIEPNVMAAEARRRVLADGHHEWGSRFAAITDESTELHRRAVQERFRDVFVNPSDIGGRYSALSFFGMVPAALMGIDLGPLLAQARGMARACREPGVAANPGVALGALMAAGVDSGRDKLTILLPDRLLSFGLWVEQLVAESTGKAGTGVVPIVGESPGVPWGDDRVAVEMRVGRADGDTSRLEHLRAAGVPVAGLHLQDVSAIGAEFLRWEVATAAAGALLAINPFDEPNVQQAKQATRALLDVHALEQRLPAPEPLSTADGTIWSASRAARRLLGDAGLDAFADLLQPGDYFCLLAYLPPEDATLARPLADLRTAVAAASGCATMFGYGPRYLHSTGQLHKGGANTGVFLVLTAEPASDLSVPGEPFTFGVLERAQALGDFQSLGDTNRRALYVHLPRREPGLIQAVGERLLAGRRTVPAASLRGGGPAGPPGVRPA